MAAGTQRSSSKKRPSGSRGGRATGSRPRATRSATKSATKSAARRPSANGASANGGGTVKPVVTAVAGAAAGVVGGVILGRKGKKGRLDGLAKNVGAAANQLGRLAGEVNQARQQAEKVGKALR